MLECTGRIDEYVGGDEARFRASRLVQDAVVRNLRTLAESSQRLTDAIKASEPDVPWRAISGFRNILVHDYLAIDVDAVWLVVDQELPRLRRVAEDAEALAGDMRGEWGRGRVKDEKARRASARRALGEARRG